MADKIITCPELCGTFVRKSQDEVEVIQWGLVEYLQDIVLPDALGTAELCDMVIRVTKNLPPRGDGQVGKPLRVTAQDWSLLCELVGMRRKAPGGPENLMATAICNRAVLVATEAPAPAAQAAE